MENGYYAQSKLHGKYKKFYDDGRIMEEGEYHMGNKMGKWYSYDNDGNRIKTKYLKF
jgi:antitoxin component YwqK of YwqJK toxin-antitoxin module